MKVFSHVNLRCEKRKANQQLPGIRGRLTAPAPAHHSTAPTSCQESDWTIPYPYNKAQAEVRVTLDIDGRISR
jgi:hypothetical protein